MIFLASVSVSAQKQGKEKIDSLLTAAKETKNDSLKVWLYKEIAFNYWSIDPNKGIEYAQKGLKIAKWSGMKKGESEIFNSLGVLHWVKGDYSAALEYYHNALKINESLKDTNAVAKNLGNIALIYKNMKNNAKALENLNRAMDINEKLLKKGLEHDFYSF